VTTVSQLADQSGVRRRTIPVPAPPATSAIPALPVLPASTRMMRPKPQRVPELGHMNLRRLRTYRRTLLNEELRASYWRRLLQARRDILRADSPLGDHGALTDVLTEERGSTGRQVILTLHPEVGMPILPQLPDLWACGGYASDDVARAELFARLASAESVLSSYREALHKRLDRATAELVARYHDEPRLCLEALPL